MDQPAFEIRQVYGVRLLPKSSTIKSREIEVFFPHAIENLSNATNSIDIEVINTGSSKGPAADLIMDDNGDGVHQEQENTQQKASVELGEGAVMHFFLRMKAPADARSGDSFSATIKASCQVKDGAGYVGDNGIIYGGDDESVSTDTLAIE